MNTKKILKWSVLPLTALGAFLYRWRGGLFENGPRPIAQALFSSFPCLFVPALVIQPGDTGILIGMFLWATVWECTGHGGWMDLGTWPKERKDERLEFLIKPFKKYMSEYWYDALGLGLTGLIVTLPAGIYVQIYGHPYEGLLLGLSGLLKTPGYMIGRALFNNTESGEWISGGLRWFMAAIVAVFLVT